MKNAMKKKIKKYHDYYCSIKHVININILKNLSKPSPFEQKWPNNC